jgi:outer membrane protein assembly factor BamB
MRTPPLLRTCLLAAACAAPFGTAAAADWLQWGYDAAHSGSNPDEATVTAANVGQLMRRYDVTMTATTNAAPVLARGIVTPSGTKDLLVVTAQSGRTTAYDAFDGSVVWTATTSGTAPTESSPAIDPNRQFVYAYGVDGKVHKYGIGDGVETTTDGWPQIATLKRGVEKGASALAFALTHNTTYLYVVNNGYVGDGGDYQGHLTTIDLSTNAQTVFNTLCSDVTIHMILNGQNGVNDCSSRQNGIWGRPGATYDAGTDRVYITTGNGPFDANTGGKDWGDSVLALKPDGTGAGGGMPMDSYTPTTYQQLDDQDIDLGSASLTILEPPAGSTVQHLGVQTGKDSKLHLLDLDRMGGTGLPGEVGGAIEVIDVPISQFWMKTQPVTWVDEAGDGATWVYLANGSGISGLKLGLDGDDVPFLLPTWQKSTNGTSAIIANGVVYHAGSCGGTCLIARNPHTGDVLWTSPPIGSVKWGSPILVDGTLYFTDRSAKVWAFGLPDAPITHRVLPASGAHGAMSPAWPQDVVDGAQQRFIFRPEPGYRLAGASGCGGSLDGSVFVTGPVHSDCTVTAAFELVTHTVTPTSSAGGSIAPDAPQTVTEGESVAFTLTPDPGHALASVTGCGGTLDGDTYTTAPVTADCTVSATFEAAVFTVTPMAGPGGSIDPDTPQDVTGGSTTSFTLHPDTGDIIASVTGCGGSLAGDIYTTGPIEADCTVSASFALDPDDTVFADGFEAAGMGNGAH